MEGWTRKVQRYVAGIAGEYRELFGRVNGLLLLELVQAGLGGDDGDR
jgi:hypothetical protein